jgi:hypothetical protein
MPTDINTVSLRLPINREARETAARAQLRQAVWEASQYMDLVEIEERVRAVLHEIESDTP